MEWIYGDTRNRFTRESGAVTMSRRSNNIGLNVGSLVILLVLNMLFSCTSGDEEGKMIIERVDGLDLSQYPATAPEKSVHLLFIHHSIGAQLLADKAPEPDAQRFYTKHPNGGGLRTLLEKNNYVVHEASFGSLIGNDTDICHWNIKFRDHMDKVLTCKDQDEFFTDGTRNKVVMIKSCYPNNHFMADGEEPGNPDSCERTLANARAAYKALLSHLQRQQDTLFIVLTAPPIAEPNQKRIKSLKKQGLIIGNEPVVNIANRARVFNNWLKDPENGWLKGYPYKNVVVFDYYDILTDYGRTNWSAYPTREGLDSHPSSEGNTKTAQELVLFLNRALHRLGL